MKVTLSWGMCVGNIWCDFNRVNLDHEAFSSANGVYIVWSNAQTIKVGVGNIKTGILNDRKNIEIAAYSDLKVTWSQASNEHLEGIKRYLIDRLTPIIDEHIGIGEQIEVNLPWR